MSTPSLVEGFYRRIWNAGELEAVSALLASDFAFCGSLGAELQGQSAFLEYVRSVRAVLADYHYEIVTCVTEGEYAFARMRFSGRHVGSFMGYEPTGRVVCWEGAALFHLAGAVITNLWVLGDLKGLDAVLEANGRGDPSLQ